MSNPNTPWGFIATVTGAILAGLGFLGKWLLGRMDTRDRESAGIRENVAKELVSLREKILDLTGEVAALRAENEGMLDTINHLTGSDKEVNRLQGILLRHGIDPETGNKFPKDS